MAQQERPDHNGHETFAASSLRDIPSIVTMEEIRSLLVDPTALAPVIITTIDGTVLACNHLAARLCGMSSSSSLLLENIYALLADALQEERVPVSCNPAFLLRKLAALKQLDPKRRWVAHQALRSEYNKAYRRHKSEPCPIPDCDQLYIKHTTWRYPFCLYRSHDPSDRSVTSLLQFRVTDAAIAFDKEPIGVYGSDVDIFDEDFRSATGTSLLDDERRFVVVFDPANDQTVSMLSEFYTNWINDKHVTYKHYSEPHYDDIDGIIHDKVESTIARIQNDYGKRGTITIERLGPLLRDLRERQGISGDQLAERIGVSRSTISHWERGRRTPQDPYILRELIELLQPGDHEREDLLAILTKQESMKLQSAATPELEFLQWSLKRIDQLMELQSQIGSQLAELRTTIHQRFYSSPEGSVALLDTAPEGRTVFERAARQSLPGDAAPSDLVTRQLDHGSESRD